MTEIFAVKHVERRFAPRLQGIRLKEQWLQDDTDSQEFDKLLTELQSFPEEHNFKAFHQGGLNFACNDCIGVQGCEDGTASEYNQKYSWTHSEIDTDLRMLNDSHLENKWLESKVKNMSIAENVDKNADFPYSKSLSCDTQQLKQNMPSAKMIADQYADIKHSKSNIAQQSKLQACIINTSKSQSPALSSSLANDAHSSKPTVVSGKTAPAANISLAELANQHRSQRARVASVREAIPMPRASVENLAKVSFPTFQHRNQTGLVGSLSNCSDSFVDSLKSSHEKLGKQNAKSMPLVLGCSSSACSLAELPAACSHRAETSLGMSLSQLALQHKQSKSPLATLSPHNGYTNGCKPSLVQLMKNVAKEKTGPFTAAEEPCSKLPSKEPASSISLTSCLKLHKRSDTSTKLPYSLEKQDTEDFGCDNVVMLMDSHLGHSGAESQEQDIPIDLMPLVSSTGFLLCSLKRKRNSEGSPSNIGMALKYPKFKCDTQVGSRVVYPEAICQKIKPFDFSTPSPDDLVKHRQKQAFTRPQKEFEL